MSPPPRQLIVHIGTHKTGSTALQRVLGDERRALATEGMESVSVARRLSAVMRSVSPDDRRLPLAASSLRRRATGRGSHRSLIISSEGFSGSPYLGYADASRVAANLAVVTESFDVRIVVYLRRQDYLLESLYAQTIKDGESWSFTEYLESLPPGALDWIDFLASFEQHFTPNKVMALPYAADTSPRPWSVIQSFGGAIGSSTLTNHPETPDRPNRRYSRVAIELARRSNPELDFEAQLVLRGMLENSGLHRDFESDTLLSERQRQDLLDRYRDSNRLLLARWDERDMESWPLGTEQSPVHPSGQSAESDSEKLLSESAATVTALTRAVSTMGWASVLRLRAERAGRRFAQAGARVRRRLLDRRARSRGGNHDA